MALFGSVQIIVPEGAQVEMDGVAIFGSRECQPCNGSAGEPLIRIRGSAAFGSIEVREGARGSFSGPAGPMPSR